MPARPHFWGIVDWGRSGWAIRRNEALGERIPRLAVRRSHSPNPRGNGLFARFGFTAAGPKRDAEACPCPKSPLATDWVGLAR